MWAVPERAASAPRVTTRADADQLVADVAATMRELEKILEVETAQVRIGRIRAGLAQEGRKTELAAAYLRGLEAVKANAVALARFTPDALESLKAAHEGFGRSVDTNRIVLATARAVSESLVKGLADEMSRASRPQSYAPPGAHAPGRSSRAEPLVVSRTL